MANHFSVALTGTVWSWFMNLLGGGSPPGESCAAIQQRPGETLRCFIQRFSQVRNIIPHISNSSVVVAFRQDVRDEKVLVKLATHDIQDLMKLFSLADKCTRVMHGTLHLP
jgi:hypothetical protein